MLSPRRPWAYVQWPVPDHCSNGTVYLCTKKWLQHTTKPAVLGANVGDVQGQLERSLLSQFQNIHGVQPKDLSLNCTAASVAVILHCKTFVQEMEQAQTHKTLGEALYSAVRTNAQSMYKILSCMEARTGVAKGCSQSVPSIGFLQTTWCTLPEFHPHAWRGCTQQLWRSCTHSEWSWHGLYCSCPALPH